MIRINTTARQARIRRKEQTIRWRLSQLNTEELEIYNFWRQYFGTRFSVWAAEEHIWRPDDPRYISGENVDETLNKRIWRIAYMKEDFPKMTRDQIIKELDKDIARQIAMLSQRMQMEIEEDNIFYELTT